MAWNIDNAVQSLQLHSSLASQGTCARHVRQAIEAGGVVLIRHESAKDYGSSLVLAGFNAYQSYQVGVFLRGDVAVIQPIPGHPHGHMAMYDGTRWISDFKQRTLYPGPGYRKHHPSYIIYRYGQVSPMATAGVTMLA